MSFTHLSFGLGASTHQRRLARLARRELDPYQGGMGVDCQGAQQLRSVFPAAVAVFILPPSMAELERRLRGRGGGKRGDAGQAEGVAGHR